jgi:ABC-type glutathione transport system ATPase component
MSLLQVRDLSHRYRRGVLGLRDPRVAVDGANLTISEGESLGLIGGSGCGKSTLARCIAGLVQPEQGSILYRGPETVLRRRTRWGQTPPGIQLLFQSARAHLNPELSIRGHLRESARLHRFQEDTEALVDEALGRFGLHDRAKALPHQLSGGEQRRVSLARVLLADPHLLIADEPTSGLDAALKADLIDLLLLEGPRRRGTLLISHDLPVVLRACTRVAVMQEGKIIEVLPVEDLVESAKHPYTRRLVHAAGLRRQP